MYFSSKYNVPHFPLELFPPHADLKRLDIKNKFPIGGTADDFFNKNKYLVPYFPKPQNLLNHAVGGEEFTLYFWNKIKIKYREF